MNEFDFIKEMEEWVVDEDFCSERLSEIANEILKMLHEREDFRINAIMNRLSFDAQCRFENLLSVLSTHQSLLNKDGTRYGTQYQFALPVIFYPEANSWKNKIFEEIPLVVMRMIADSLRIHLGEDDFNIYIHPNIIDYERLQVSFPDTFYLFRDLNEDKTSHIKSKFPNDKPTPFFIYFCIQIPKAINILNMEIEHKCSNPVFFRPYAKKIQDIYSSHLRVKGSSIKVMVGNPAPVHLALGNSNGDIFISDVLMSMSMTFYENEIPNIMVEICSFEEKTYVIFYIENQCTLAYLNTNESFLDLEYDNKRHDADYYKMIIEESGIKRVIMSNRDLGLDLMSFIGKHPLMIN